MIKLCKGLWIMVKVMWIAVRHPPAPPTPEEILDLGRQRVPPMSYPPPWVIWQSEPHHHHGRH